MLLLRRPPTLETPHCPISFKFLAEVLSDCKYLWRTMQLLDQGFTCLLFFFPYALCIPCASLSLCLAWALSALWSKDHAFVYAHPTTKFWSLCAPSREQPRQRAPGENPWPYTQQCDQSTLGCLVWKNKFIFRQLFSTHSECNSSWGT